MRDRLGELAAAFSTALPFPHVVLDDCLDLDPRQLASFPDVGWPHWRSLGEAYQHEKRARQERAVIPAPWANCSTS